MAGVKRIVNLPDIINNKNKEKIVLDTTEGIVVCSNLRYKKL